MARALWFRSLLLVCWAVLAHGQSLDDLLDGAAPNVLDENDRTDELTQEMGGGTRFRFAPVDRPDEELGSRLFWRRFGGYRGVHSVPATLRLNDKPIIAPKTVTDPVTKTLSSLYPIEGRAFIAAGTHRLRPGDLTLTSANGKLTSGHPAVAIAGDEVRILCAPVRLEEVDSEGRPVPSRIRISCGGLNLLREEVDFNPLLLWLPIGVTYQSSMGTFAVALDGKVTAEPAALAAGVVVTPEGLRLVAAAKPPVARTPAVIDAHKLFVTGHRGRTVFTQQETANFAVLVPRGCTGGRAQILLRPAALADAAEALALGEIELPAVADREFDSRQFELDASTLQPGRYVLTVKGPAAGSDPLPLTVVAWYDRSPFFVHSYYTGMESDSAQPATQLATLHSAGFEMTSFSLDNGMSTWGTPRPGEPPELALKRSTNDLLLENLLAQQMRSFDLIVTRAAGLYNEGLSYHHSYQPSVDRMIRRMQVFTQQTADYPSFYAINYAWFPSLFGYAEAGVPTDAHVADRNRVLWDNLAKAGYTNATQEDLKWYKANKLADDAATRAKAQAIARQAVRYWKAQMDFGFGRHNRLYNEAIRAVRSQTLCTLFENAGHDAQERTRSLFNDMAAICYESYTDYGEWVMSTGYTTDWARGNAPGRPVWITVDWGTSSEGMMKSLFHGLARGLNGGGTPIGSRASETLRRGKGMNLAAQYGALSQHAVPDGRFAILVTDAEQIFNGRAPYLYHALYYHLTRLGCPPVLIDEETVTAGGIPASVRALFIARQQHPFEPAVTAALADFQARGGKLAVTADSLVKPDGAVVIDAQLTHIWQLSGFAWGTHVEMWNEFESNWRAPLTKALEALDLPAFATTDCDRGLTLGMEAGPVRYAVVIADARDTHYSVFEPTLGLPVSLEGTGWSVRDLVKQTDLAATTRDGRTEVAVDLINEPVTLLALYKAAPDKLTLTAPATPPRGGELLLNCRVTAAGADLGPVPVTYVLKDAAGTEQFRLHRAAGDNVSYRLPELAAAGTWTLSVQELLTGLTATAPLTVGALPAASPAKGIRIVEDVQTINVDHLRRFAARRGEKAIIVEPGQSHLLPLARKLAEGLAAAGMAARVWTVRPEDFDTLPVRFYPQPEDTARLALIEQGRLIGFREDLEPVIDAQKRAHLAEKGGYAEIEPRFMVGQDCILFSGGQLAASLRAVTPWMNTPNVPGVGQGRLLTVFSPFLADRQVVAVIANDAAGMAKAADRLREILTTPPAPGKTAIAANPGTPLNAAVQRAPVAQPFLNYAPWRRVRRVLANDAGQVTVQLRGRHDTVAFVDAAGKVTATVALEDDTTGAARLDAEGRLWHYRTAKLADGTREVRVRGVRPDGTVDRGRVVYRGSVAHMGPHEAEAAFPVAPDGRTAAFGRLGGLWLGNLGADAWRWCSDMPHVRKTFEVWTPRFPTAMTFSPDSRYLFFTMDGRPTGYENMHQRLNRNEGGESALLDVTTGERAWTLRGDVADFSCANGFAAVARDGEVTAFFDVWSRVGLVDKRGRIIAQELLRPKKHRNDFEVRPVDGLGAWIAPGGTLAAYATLNQLVLGTAAGFVKVALPEICAVTVLDEGPLAVVGLAEGEVKAFDPQGREVWSAKPGGFTPQLASAKGAIHVGTTLGELVTFDRAGHEIRRLDLLTRADRERHEPQVAAGLVEAGPPHIYQEPNTLAVAQERLAAKQVGAWQPTGAGSTLFGRSFHTVETGFELANPVEGDGFVHLVYRRPAGSKSLKVIFSSAAARETVFELDLPTPSYRVVDLPFRGAGIKIRVAPEGALELAECTLWSMRWPGQNMAFVTPADAGGNVGGDLTAATGGKGDADLLELEEFGGGGYGRMKETRIWCSNPDIDKIAGLWLTGPNGLHAVNGLRWDLGSWRSAKFIGEWLTQEYGSPAEVSLAATYDSARVQSRVTERLSVFRNALSGARAQGGEVIGAVIDNDQFWRLFSTKPVRATIFGAYVYSEGLSEGLSEFELYQ